MFSLHLASKCTSVTFVGVIISKRTAADTKSTAVWFETKQG